MEPRINIVKLSCLQVGLAFLLITAHLDLARAFEADGDGIIEAGEVETEELAKAAQNPGADISRQGFR